MLKQFLSSLGSAIAAAWQSITSWCSSTGRWVTTHVPGAARFAKAYGQIFKADLEDMPALPAFLGAFGGLAIAGSAGLAGIPAAAVVLGSGVAAHVGRQAVLAGIAASVGAAADSRLGRRVAAGARGAASGAAELVADLAPGAARGLGRAGRGIGRGVGGLAEAGMSAVSGVGTLLGAVASVPGRILGRIGGGGGSVPGAAAYEQIAAAATAQDPRAAKRAVQLDRQVAAAVRDAAATRADAIDDARPEAGHERDRGLPANVIGWLDRLSPDELRVVARLPSEDIGKVLSGGEVLGVRPLATQELGRDCISVWTAAALAQEVTQHEALRASMASAPAILPGSVPVTPGDADADMQALHELDQRYRAQLRPARPSSIAAGIQAAAARRQERERASSLPPVDGLIVH